MELSKILIDLNNQSQTYEQSIEPLVRKQTGCYYTSLELTKKMMKDLVFSLSNYERNHLFEKTFFEPCVGTGNFVFAYLLICYEMNYSHREYEQLINNIYVCDINQSAISIYKKNLSNLVKKLFNIDLDEEYFKSHIGGALLFNVSANSIDYIGYGNYFPEIYKSGGFDIIVTNPPYKNLKAESGHYHNKELYIEDQKKYAQIAVLSKEHFTYSTYGVLNTYKLFVEEIIDKYASKNAICSLLIPASILSDKTCFQLRNHILASCRIVHIQMLPEKNNYIDASQALCALLLHKGKVNNETIIEGNIKDSTNNRSVVKTSELIDKTSDNAILMLSDNEYHLKKQMQQHPTIKELSFIDNLRGELDLTANKNYIVKEPTPYTLLRGRNIDSYAIIEANNEFVSDSFVKTTAKKQYISNYRLACQQIANMSKQKRVRFTLIPPGYVLANSCNFIAVKDNPFNIDVYYILGILNSPLINWYFKLTSSNNHINNYEIDNFPIPINYKGKHNLSNAVVEYLKEPTEEKLNHINNLVYEAYNIDDIWQKKDGTSGNDTYEDVIVSFFNDVKNIIKDISFEECKRIIENRASLLDITLQKKPAISAFEKKVLAQIEIKYKKLSQNHLLNHTTFKLSDLDLEMISAVPQGGSWKNIPVSTVKKSKRLTRITQTGGRTTLYGRIDYSQPSYTITTYFNRPGNGTYVHPTQERVISVREAARFQTFPDNYYFCGNKTDLLKQVGNAVPVIMAYNIGKSIIEKTGCSTSVDLFSGAGGMTYGFKCAGIKAVISNDIVENACITLKTNSPEIPVLCGDLTKEDIKQRIISAGKSAKADIICGGPPCQGFSMAGFRKQDDPRNELFRHFAEIVAGVNPKIIVFENVEGLLSYQNGETYRNIIELFAELGYNCEGRKLMANYYGVPQKRKRVIILCTRKDLAILPNDIFPEYITPSENAQITARDTIGDLETIPCSENAIYRSAPQSELQQYFRGEKNMEEYIKAIKEQQKNTCQNIVFDSPLYTIDNNGQYKIII